MPKFLIRIVALLLISYMLSDSALASATSLSSEWVGGKEVWSQRSAFAQEALQVPVLNDAPRGFDPQKTAKLFSATAALLGLTEAVLSQNIKPAFWGIFVAVVIAAISQAGRQLPELVGGGRSLLRPAERRSLLESLIAIFNERKDPDEPPTLPATSGDVRDAGPWRVRLSAWEESYTGQKKKISEAAGAEGKLRELETLEQMAEREIAQIKASEYGQDLAKIYPPIIPRGIPWNKGLRKFADSRWKEKEVDQFYYHGTSLGVALIAYCMNGLGGIKEFTELSALEGESGQETFLETTAFARKDDVPSLGHVINAISWYADRTTRITHAIVAYYALRDLWEKDSRFSAHPFPPFAYFTERALLRIPRQEVKGVRGSSSVDTRAYKPIPLVRADVLVGESIPVPRRSFYDLGELSGNDPESPVTPGDQPLTETEKDAYYDIIYKRGLAHPVHLVAEFTAAIGNSAMTRWQPLHRLALSLPPAVPELSTRDAVLIRTLRSLQRQLRRQTFHFESAYQSLNRLLSPNIQALLASGVLHRSNWSYASSWKQLHDPFPALLAVPLVVLQTLITQPVHAQVYQEWQRTIDAFYAKRDAFRGNSLSRLSSLSYAMSAFYTGSAGENYDEQWMKNDEEYLLLLNSLKKLPPEFADEALALQIWQLAIHNDGTHFDKQVMTRLLSLGFERISGTTSDRARARYKTAMAMAVHYRFFRLEDIRHVIDQNNASAWIAEGILDVRRWESMTGFRFGRFGTTTFGMGMIDKYGTRLEVLLDALLPENENTVRDLVSTVQDRQNDPDPEWTQALRWLSGPVHKARSPFKKFLGFAFLLVLAKHWSGALILHPLSSVQSHHTTLNLRAA